MKSKLGIVLFLLFVFSLDGAVLAKELNINSISSPDGVAVVKQRRRRHSRRYTRRRAKIYRTSDAGRSGGNVSTPEPVTEQSPASPPPPVESRPDIYIPERRARAKRSAPRIKPPTVQIKPPTR